MEEEGGKGGKSKLTSEEYEKKEREDGRYYKKE